MLSKLKWWCLFIVQLLCSFIVIAQVIAVAYFVSTNDHTLIALTTYCVITTPLLLMLSFYVYQNMVSINEDIEVTKLLKTKNNEECKKN